MSTVDEQKAKLEYFKLIQKRSDEIISTENSMFRSFYMFSLIFFIFTWFETSELSMFGAKIQVPEDWIIMVAPLVLSYFLFRLVYLEYSLSEYGNILEELLPESIRGDGWEPSKEQIDIAISRPTWSISSGFIKSMEFGFLTINTIYLLTIFLLVYLIPIAIIIYFNSLVWQLENKLVVILVTITSIVILILSILISIYTFKKDFRG